MRILVNGVHLYFDVEGAGLVPHGAQMQAKPTLLLLHGGPGADHSGYKPYFLRFADIAQVVYLDHRGNGRSDAASSDTWNLAQWADDVVAFCAALQITRPIVYGASFGGMVAMAYATRHPGHAGALVLVSTEASGPGDLPAKVAMFERLGGAEVGALARRRFIERQTDRATLARWLDVALPQYTRRVPDPDAWSRMLSRPEVTHWFMRFDGESRRFNLLPELHRITCPTLVMGGQEDPMTPIQGQRDIAAALTGCTVRFEEFAQCGHGVVADAPERAERVLREFVAQVCGDASGVGS